MLQYKGCCLSGVERHCVVLCWQIYIDFFSNIVYTNAAALIIALLCMAAIYAVQRWVNPIIKQKIKMPLPIELIVVCMQKFLSFIFFYKI